MPNLVQTTRALLEEMSKPQIEAKETPVDKAHFCATHVEHALYGAGTCISEAHADPDAEGNIAWYTVQFPDAARKIETKDLKITMGESHMHSKKKEKEEKEEMDEALHPNQKKIDVAEPKGKLTSADFSALRAGKKASVKEDVEQANEGAMSDLDASRKDKQYQGLQAHKAKMKVSAEDQFKIGKPKPEKPKFSKMPGIRSPFVSAKKMTNEDFDLVDIDVVLEGIVPIQIPANPTFEHYLNAINFIIDNDSEEVQKEVVALATEAFANKEIDVLVRAQYMFTVNEASSMKIPTATGMRVMGHRYGDSASATRNQTKKELDTMSGPSKKDMEKMAKAKAKK